MLLSAQTAPFVPLACLTFKLPFEKVVTVPPDLSTALKVAKTFEGVSTVCVGVPLTVKLFPLPELSVPNEPEFSNFKKKPFVP